MELEKAPVPVPSFVLELAVDGSGNVLQQTPLRVIESPPFQEIFPPPDAVVVVAELIGAVVMSPGTVVLAVNVTSFP